MRWYPDARRILAICTLAALPLVVGSQCAFIFSSNTGSSGKDDDRKEEENIIVKAGTFSEPVTRGISYESGSLAGITGSDGEFQYEEGNTVRFSIGDVSLGAPVGGKPALSPRDLAGTGAGNSISAINIERLLRSLDTNPEDAVVTIPKAVRAAAVRSNGSVSAAIEFLDFSDDIAFANAASELVAQLTGDYPYTATLLDSDSAGENRTRSLDVDPGP